MHEGMQAETYDVVPAAEPGFDVVQFEPHGGEVVPYGGGPIVPIEQGFPDGDTFEGEFQKVTDAGPVLPEAGGAAGSIESEETIPPLEATFGVNSGIDTERILADLETKRRREEEEQAYNRLLADIVRWRMDGGTTYSRNLDVSMLPSSFRQYPPEFLEDVTSKHTFLPFEEVLAQFRGIFDKPKMTTEQGSEVVNQEVPMEVEAMVVDGEGAPQIESPAQIPSLEGIPNVPQLTYSPAETVPPPTIEPVGEVVAGSTSAPLGASGAVG